VGAPAFVDYYELLQVSPNADDDTIQRVFRHLAKKHHPDASEQSDSSHFNRLLDAYRTLTDIQARAAYDVRYQRHWDQNWKVASEAGTSSPDNTDDVVIRERLLSLLYVQRRRHMRHPGLGELEIARLMDLPAEHLSFQLWYLREKGWVARLDTGYLAITAEGVDKVEESRLRLDPDRLIEARPPEDGAQGDVSSDESGKPSA
jgi:curved DNA-binding protein CbpA